MDEVVERILGEEDINKVLRNIRGMDASGFFGTGQGSNASTPSKKADGESVGMMSPSMSPGSKLAGAGELRRRLRGEREGEQRVKDVLDVGREFAGGGGGGDGEGGELAKIKVVSPIRREGEVAKQQEFDVIVREGKGGVPGKVMVGRWASIKGALKGGKKVFGHSPPKGTWGERKI